MPTRTLSLAQTDELQPGQMKSVEVDGHPILLGQIGDQYFAMYGACTHYGAPLADGILAGHRVVCPWHHACFDLRSGKHLEAPGLDSVPSYPVTVQGNELMVELPEELTDRVEAPMADLSPDNEEHYVVIGGGAAGAYAVEGMRQAGFTGKISLISAEAIVPYDRPNCSKEYLSDEAPAEWMPLRGPEFYREHGIDLHLGQRVHELDPSQNRIRLSDGSEMRYDKVLVCTGGKAKTLPIEGVEAPNVYPLRSIRDSQDLREAAKAAQQVVVVGASFIGMEAAMSLGKLGPQVTVVGPEDEPFERVFGTQVGQLARQLHERNGTKFHLARKVERIEVQDGRAQAVVLDDGTQLAADLVVLGVGVQPATDFLLNFHTEADGGLKTDAHLHAGNNVFAAGDLVHHPYRGQHVRIEHWKVAAQQGRAAGRNMAGAKEPYQAEPFFWSMQPGTAFGYVGHATDYDQVVIDGELDPENPAFIAYYLKGEEVQAALAAAKDEELSRVQEAFFEGKYKLEEVRQK